MGWKLIESTIRIPQSEMTSMCDRTPLGRRSFSEAGCSMNTRLSGSARVDSTNVLPSGELRGLPKLIKITEDVRKYAAEQGLADAEALRRGLEQKSHDFADAGAEIYQKG